MPIWCRVLLFVVLVLQLGWGLTKLRDECRVHRSYDLVPVVVAARDLEVGATITWEDLSQRAVPEQMLRTRDVRPDKAAELLGRQVRLATPAGEPISLVDLWEPPRLGFGVVEYALTLPTLNALAGKLAPGDCVDAMLDAPGVAPRLLAGQLGVTHATHDNGTDEVVFRVHWEDLAPLMNVHPEQLRLVRAQAGVPRTLRSDTSVDSCPHPP